MEAPAGREHADIVTSICAKSLCARVEEVANCTFQFSSPAATWRPCMPFQLSSAVIGHVLASALRECSICGVAQRLHAIPLSSALSDPLPPFPSRHTSTFCKDSRPASSNTGHAPVTHRFPSPPLLETVVTSAKGSPSTMFRHFTKSASARSYALVGKLPALTRS